MDNKEDCRRDIYGFLLKLIVAIYDVENAEIEELLTVKMGVVDTNTFYKWASGVQRPYRPDIKNKVNGPIDKATILKGFFVERICSNSDNDKNSTLVKAIKLCCKEDKWLKLAIDEDGKKLSEDIDELFENLYKSKGKFILDKENYKKIGINITERQKRGIELTYRPFDMNDTVCRFEDNRHKNHVVDDFKGRTEEISLIDNDLSRNGWIYLYSICGVGKGELVKKYINLYQKKYKQVFFLKYHRSIKLTISMDLKWKHQYEEENPSESENFEDQKVEQINKIYKDKMKFVEQLGEDTLIVFNHFNIQSYTEDMQEGGYFDKDFNVFKQLKCHVIFLPKNKYDKGHHITSLKSEELIELFKESYKMIGHTLPNQEHYIKDIIAKVAGHTLTCILVAKTLQANPDVTLQMMCEMIHWNVLYDRTEHILYEDDGVLHSETVYRHLERIFSITDMSEPESKVLLNLTLVPQCGIDRKQFKIWIGLKDYNPINKLINLGWVSQLAETDRILMHPVFADMIAFRQKDQLNIQKCGEYIMNLVQWLEQMEEGYSGLGVNDLLETRSRAIQLGYESLKRIHEKSELTGKINYLLSSLNRSIAELDEAEKLIEKATEIYKQLNFTGIEIAKVHRVHGRIYADRADYDKALEFYKIAYKTNPAHTADEIRVKVKLLNSIGYACYQKKEYQQAEENLQRVINISQQNDILQENDILLYANSLRLMGICKSGQRNFIEALDYKKKALETIQSYHIDKPLELGVYLSSLATAYEELSDFENALKHHFNALEIKKKKYGEKHPSVALSYSKIATVYTKLHDYENACFYNKSALEIREEKLPENHIHLAASYGKLGKSLAKNGQPQEGIDCLKKAIAIYESRNDEKNTRVADFKNDMGSALREMGYVEKSFKLHSEVLEILGPDPIKNLSRIATTYLELGEDEYALGKYENALNNFMSTLNYLSNDQNQNTPRIGRANEKIGLAFMSMGKEDLALPYFKGAFAIYTQIYPEGHKSISEILELIDRVQNCLL